MLPHPENKTKLHVTINSMLVIPMSMTICKCTESVTILVYRPTITKSSKMLHTSTIRCWNLMSIEFIPIMRTITDDRLTKNMILPVVTGSNYTQFMLNKLFCNLFSVNELVTAVTWRLQPSLNVTSWLISDFFDVSPPSYTNPASCNNHPNMKNIQFQAQ